jgi:hypothetical protein
MRDVLIALLLTFVESAVRMVEDRFKNAPGPKKRASAFQYVKDRAAGLQAMLGPFAMKIDDSVVYGMIDATVQSLHKSEEFSKHTTHAADARHDDDDDPPAPTTAAKKK